MQQTITPEGQCTKSREPRFHSAQFREGMRDGLPIGLGYFAVSFTLGIAARTAGLSAFQAMLASLLNNASAGEYAGFTLIAAGASLGETALLTLITNARYLLMSCALSQHLSPGTPLWQRLVVGFDITDEVFGISVARPTPLDPQYTFGAMAVSIPGWAIGTFLGVVAGNLLPARAVSALSVALYGMFLAVIIPPARKDKKVAGVVLAAFAASFAATKLPLLAGLSAGTRMIVLTLVLAGAAAAIFPVKEDSDHEA